MPESELWDVLDEQGRPIGQTYRRGDSDWPDGRFHLVVATCSIRSDGRVLLTQRAASKDFPLAWEFPGGSALVGESSSEAALRELREETGLVAPGTQLALVGRHAEATALVDLYTAVVGDSFELRLDPDEVHAAEWLTLAQVRERLDAGRMAEPWLPRLTTLWPALTRDHARSIGPIEI